MEQNGCLSFFSSPLESILMLLKQYKQCTLYLANSVLRVQSKLVCEQGGWLLAQPVLYPFSASFGIATMKNLPLIPVPQKCRPVHVTLAGQCTGMEMLWIALLEQNIFT